MPVTIYYARNWLKSHLQFHKKYSDCSNSLMICKDSQHHFNWSIRNWVKTFQTILVSDSLTTSSQPYLSQRTSITISQKSLLENMEICSPWAKLWKKVLGNVLLHQTNPQEILEDNFAEPVQLTMYKQPRTELGRVPNKLVYRKWRSAWDSMPLTRQPKKKERNTYLFLD